MSIHFDMSFADYRKAPGVNVSALKVMQQSPLHYRHALANPRPQTAALTLGTAAHCATLEPARFASSFAVWTGARRAGKEWEQFKADAAGRDILTEDERDTALAIAAAVRACPEAMHYLRFGNPEVSMFWPDAETAIASKGRVDWLAVADGEHVLVGLKTARSIIPREFAAQAARLCYHWQWAYYADGYEAHYQSVPGVVEIVVESAPPHAVAVYRIPENVIEQGRAEYRAALKTLAECERTGNWPGPVVGEVTLDLPHWAYGPDTMTIEDAEEET